jgi:transposase
VDLHRKTLFVVIVDLEGNELLARRFPASVAGEAELLQQLQPGDRVVIEATAGAHRWANRLESTGAHVCIADPQQTRLWDSGARRPTTGTVARCSNPCAPASWRPSGDRIGPLTRSGS